MDGIIIFIMGLMAVAAFAAVFWYLFQTLRIIWSYNPLLAILAVILSPIVHVVFYLIPKDSFDDHEKSIFKKYFLSIFAVIALGIAAAVAIPAVKDSQNKDTLYSDEYDMDDERAAELHLDAIYQAHPDAADIVTSYGFEFWQQGKTEVEQNEIARVLREGTAPEVIYIISLFKKETQN